MNMRTAGDVVAELFDAHAPALLLYARQWVGEAEAQDVIQRVFVGLLSGSTIPAQPRSWLFRCVRNEAMAVWRATRRRGRRERIVAENAPAWFDPRPDDPLSAAEAQEALASLPQELREVVTLRLWGDLTLSEIAEITGVAVSTVHARYATAIESLRKAMDLPCRNPKN